MKTMLLCVWFLFAILANASPILDSNGHLMGISAMSINNGLYDVTFSDGPLQGVLFDGDSTMAALAASELLTTVLIGTYTEHPNMINGCSMGDYCDVMTPYGFWNGYTTVKVSYDGSPSYNTSIANSNFVFDAGLNCLTCDMYSQNRAVWAIWSHHSDNDSDDHHGHNVPEPSSLMFIVFGLIALTRVPRLKKGEL